MRTKLLGLSELIPGRKYNVGILSTNLEFVGLNNDERPLFKSEQGEVFISIFDKYTPECCPSCGEKRGHALFCSNWLD